MKLYLRAKKFIAAGVALALLVVSVQSFAMPVFAATGKTVKMGYFPEAGMMNGAEEGTPKSGYAYEYIQELASDAGWKYEYVYSDFSTLYKMLLNGEIDMLPYITWTEERSHEMLFPNTQMGDEQFYLAGLTRERMSEDLHELQGKRVAVTKDAFHLGPFKELLAKKGLTCQIVECKGPEDRWAALEKGIADYSIESSTVLQGTNMHLIYEFGDKYPYYVVVAQGREDLLEEMNKAQSHLNELNPGFPENIKYKYFKGIPLYKEIPAEGIAWLNSHDVIRIGTFDKDEPYCIENEDGTVSGIAPDYLEIMMKSLEIDIPVEWIFYSSNQEGIAALRAGEIDLFNPYYRNYSDAEADGVVISNEVYSSSMSILYDGAYTDKTMSVIATPNTRLGAIYVRDNYPGSTIVMCSNGYDCMDKFRAGEATCVVLYTDALYEISAKYQKDYNIKSLNARCPVCFAALPENAALITVINKGVPFVSDIEMNDIQDTYSAEKSVELTPLAFLLSHPEFLAGTLAIILGVALVMVLYNRKKEKIFESKQKESEFFKNVIDRFTVDFQAVIHGNIDDDTYEVLASNGEMDSLFEGTKSLFTEFERFLSEKVYSLDKERIEKEMVHIDQIREKLEIGESAILEYRSNNTQGYTWYRAMMSRISENEVLIGYKECEKEILTRIMNDKLMDEYDAIYYIDLNRNEILPAKPSRVSEVGAFTHRVPYTSTVLKFAETVAPEYTTDWMNFSDPVYMKQYMAEEDHREYVFELPGISRSMRRFTVDVIERVHDEVETVLFSFMGIDDVRAQTILLHKQMAQQKMLLDYFVDSFSSAYFVNLEEDTFEILHMNSEFSDLFGKNGDTMESMSRFIDEHVHPDDRELMYRMIDKKYVTDRLRNEPSFTFNIREVVKNEERTMRGLIVRVTDENHIAVGFMDISKEVREEKEKEQQLSEALSMAQSANRAKTTFLNNMSHDIRTPMNAIIGFTELAKNHIDNKEQVKDYLKKIGQSSDHLLSLINDVLDMSRIESGKMKIEERPENLDEIVQTLSSIIQADLAAKRHTFTVNTEAVSHMNIICDRLRVNQVLLNILSNSIKYTADGGNITMRITEKKVWDGMNDAILTHHDVTTTGQGELSVNGLGRENCATYEFCIMDNGMGMDEEYLRTIYDPFTRVKSSTVSGIQGTGLGMAITKNIIDLMGGKIEIASTPGEGTRTTVTVDFRLCEESDVDSNNENDLHNAAGLGAGVSKAMATGGTGRADDGVSGTAGGAGNADHEQESAAKDTFTHDFTGKKVLLVEDNELNREIATDLLGEEGFVLDIAEDGDIAVDKIKNAHAGDYDLILMDIQMPRMDGYQATREIRALGTEISQIPIIAMTANAFEEDRKAALEAGMNEHIPKPIRINVLKEIISKFV